jgi:hypothetical protein
MNKLQLHKRVTEKCPVNLEDHQVEHTQKLWNTLAVSTSCVSTAQGGLGKTHVALCIAWWLNKAYGMKVMVVGPNDSSLTSADSWGYWANEYDIPLEIATTYTMLRGGQGTVSHDWLIPDKNDKTNWCASKKFEKLCEEGLFIIFDEFHKATRKSITHNACAALVRCAKKYRCRISLLSYTPGDKAEHITQILRMAGIVSSERMFKYQPHSQVYETQKYGLGELEQACRKFAKTAKREIDNTDFDFENINAKKSHVIALKLYEKYIRPVITHAMPKPVMNVKVEMLNAFLETDGKSLELLENGIAMLRGAVAWNANLQQVGDQNEWSLANIGNALKMIEQGKLLSIARYVREESMKFPNKKFVISCGARGIEHHDILKTILYKEYVPDMYKEIMQELKRKNPDWRKLPKDMMNYIADFLKCRVHPDVLNGQLGRRERNDVLRKFQEDSNNSWCLIISPGVGAEAISLHDKFGGRGREMLIIPDFYWARTVQSSCRVVRVGMKSDAKVLMIYSKNGALETSILNSMIRKSKTAREIMAQDQVLTFPNDYSYWIQGERDIDLENRLVALQNL